MRRNLVELAMRGLDCYELCWSMPKQTLEMERSEEEGEAKKVETKRKKGKGEGGGVPLVWI